MTTVEQTIQERNRSHGDYEVTARVAQIIKQTLRQNATAVLDTRTMESLDMIATKLARIVSGDPRDPDHWHDIAGYARLVEDALRPQAEPTRTEALAAAQAGAR